jgi:hypothetical protein
MNPTEELWSQFDRVRNRALAVGVAALIVCILGGLAGNPQQFFHSYLLAYLFWVGVTLGCFAVVMMYHLVGGTWGYPVLRLLESGAQAFPLMVILFVPILVGMRDVFVWARPAAVSASAVLQAKAPYLNFPFFVLRAVIYFAIWIVFAYLLNKWSLEHDRTGQPVLLKRLQYLSGPGLILFALTVTFASVDWVMSLEAHFFSTIFGMLFMVAFVMEGIAFTAIVSYCLAQREPLSRTVRPSHSHDLGNLMLAFVLLWAYLAFSQLLIIWAENLTDEIPFYMHRSAGGWQWLGLGIFAFQFALPFVLLLQRMMKRRAQLLMVVAVIILCMRLVDVFWLVEPSYHPTGFFIHWMDVVAPIGLGGIWVAAFLWHLKGKPLLPVRDLRYAGTPGQYPGV